MSKPMTYQEWKTNHPTFWNDNEYSLLFEELCDDWFYFRRIGNTDEKFTRIYKRNIDKIYDRWLSICQLEGIRRDCDYFVFNFSQDWSYGRGTNSGNSESNTTEHGSSFNSDDVTVKTTTDNETTDHLDRDLKDTNDGENHATGHAENNTNSDGHVKTHDESNNNGDNRHIDVNLPMSNAGLPAGATLAEAPLDWTAASSISQDTSKTNGTSDGTNDTNDHTDGTADTSNDSNYLNTAKHTGTEDKINRLSGEVNDIKNGEQRGTKDNSLKVESNHSDSTENTSLNINTGRSGKGPAEILEEAYKCITSFVDVDFVYNALNVCFYGLCEEEE